jgi:DNA topoisomerase-3
MQKFKQAIITEKQNQADKMVEGFGLSQVVTTKGGGKIYYDQPGGRCVVPLSGHIIGLKPPEFYVPELGKNWALEHLPVKPSINEFKFEVQNNAKAKRLLSAVSHALNDIGAEELVIASDNDKEGELLVWEVLRFIGQENHPSKTRMLYAEITVEAITEAYNARVDAEAFRARFFAGLARLYSDWLYGMNITMALSVENNDKIPPRSVLNSGRVIFAISYILYLRENEILNFTPKTYFNISAVFEAAGGKYKGKLVLIDKFKDPETGLLMNAALAQKIMQTVKSRPKAKITDYEAGLKKQGPPLGFDRTGFSSHLAKKYKMSLKTINDTMQALYDEHSLLTYPRVDIEYIDVKMFDKMPPVIDAMKANILNASYMDDAKKDLFKKVFDAVDATRKSRIFKKGINDDESHHAIIPTKEVASLDSLNENERLMYEEACKRLIMQFLPDYIYHNTKITTKVVDSLAFVTTGNIPRKLGWRIFEKPEPDEDDEKGTLPEVALGDVVDVVDCQAKQEKTKCPKRYSDDELLNVLKKPGKFIQNKALLKRLKKIEIGTSATRENHVTELETKGYYDKRKDGAGKSAPERIFPTQKLMSVIKIAPPYFLYPEVSAYWEESFNNIEKDISLFEPFMDGQYKILDKFFADLREGKFKLATPIGNPKPCPEKDCEGSVYCSKIPKKKFKLWLCAKCQNAWFDDKGKIGGKLGDKSSPKPKTPFNPTKTAPCPKCKKGKVGFKSLPGKKYNLWQCLDEVCGGLFFDVKGKPGKVFGSKK